MKRIFLVRHCEATGQDAGAPLTSLGHVQADSLAAHLETAGIDLLVTSPFTRARQSVAPLAQRIGLPVETDARLAERVLSAAPLGHWREALRQTFSDPDLVWPGGESSRTAMERGRAALDALLTRPARAPVVVTHGNLMALILRSFHPRFGFETWEGLSNPDVYRITFDGEHVDVARTWKPAA